MATLKEFFTNILSQGRKDHEGDKPLVIITSTIVVFGLIMLSSASLVVSYTKYGDSYYFLKRQIFGLFLGIIAYWIFSRIDYHFWRKYAFFMLVFSVFLLILVFIPGIAADWGTARSWIDLGFMHLQPSEFVKITFLIYLAAWLESRRDELHDFSRGIGPFVLVLGVIAFLMILQPDIGTLSIIGLISLIVYFVGGGSKKHLLYIVLSGAIVLSVLLQYNDYQANRFRCLVDSDFSATDVCYQVKQSLIAVGSGGIIGRGIGASRQKFMYLPEVQNDSIFSIVGEETGLIFSSILVILYILLFYRGFLIARQAPDNYGSLLTVGLVSWITLQALINIGGMINILPMTGVPLPLISYGGSAMIATLAAVGIVVNISKQTR